MKNWSKMIAIGLCVCMMSSVALAETAEVDTVSQATRTQTQQMNGPQAQGNQTWRVNSPFQGGQNSQTNDRRGPQAQNNRQQGMPQQNRLPQGWQQTPNTQNQQQAPDFQNQQQAPDAQNQQQIPAAPDQQQTGEPRMTVQTGNNGRLNMREAPQAGANVVGRYPNGTQVEVLDVSDEWVKVRINGKTGYMMIKFLEGDLPETGEQTEAPDTQDGERPELPDTQDGERPELPDTQNGERPELPNNTNGMPGNMNGMPGSKPGNMNGAPNGAPGMGGPGFESEAAEYSAANVITESSAGESYTSSGSGENAVLVSQGDVTLSGATVSKTGSSSSESADFYGINAAVLATGGSTLTIADAQITSDGGHANGVFSYGSGTTVNVSDTAITTSGNNSGGLMTTGGATLNAENVTVATSGNSSAAIRSDRGGGTVNVSGGSYDTTGVGSPAIYSTADITVSDASLSATASEAVVIEGGNTVTLNNVNITGSNTQLNGQSTVKTNVLIYQSMSGDASEGDSSFTMEGGSMTAETGAMFHVTNTTATITLKDVDFTYAADSAVFLDASADSWGKAGTNGGNVTLNLVDQDITGAILSDSVSAVSVILDGGSTWTLTGDSSIASFTGDLSQVNLNGYTLSINGEAVTA